MLSYHETPTIVLEEQHCHHVNESGALLSHDGRVRAVATGCQISLCCLLLTNLAICTDAIRATGSGMAHGGLMTVPQLHHLSPVLTRQVLEHLDLVLRHDYIITCPTGNAQAGLELTGRPGHGVVGGHALLDLLRVRDQAPAHLIETRLDFSAEMLAHWRDSLDGQS